MPERNFLVKNEDTTNPEYGKEPFLRSISELLESGFITIDKDSGPTSHGTTDYVKKILDIDKAGHSGTLDPKVTGVLVTGLGKATRLMEYMLKSDKVYICLCYFHKEISDKDLEKVFKEFTGKIKQLPPIISAVKREEREREIYSMNILGTKENNKYVLFKVSCQHGTYIRKLCSDMGDFLKVKAQMVELRRTKAGPFTEDDSSISLDKLRNLWELFHDEFDENKKAKVEIELRRYIRPMEDLLVDFKKIYVRDSAIDSVSHGIDLAIPGITKFEIGIEKDEEIAILSLKGELIAMGTALMSSEDIKKENKGMAVKTNKVFIDIGTYPTLEEMMKEQNKEKK